MAPKRRDFDEVVSTVYKYEAFIEERLKPDLYKALEQRNKIYDQISDYLKLRNDVELIQSTNQTELKVQVDLGSNIYCQARVPDVSKLYVDVGFGFHVEMTLEEVLAFIPKRVLHLEKFAKDLTKQANQVRAHIKMVMEALQELQFAIDTGT